MCLCAWLSVCFPSLCPCPRLCLLGGPSGRGHFPLLLPAPRHGLHVCCPLSILPGPSLLWPPPRVGRALWGLCPLGCLGPAPSPPPFRLRCPAPPFGKAEGGSLRAWCSGLDLAWGPPGGLTAGSCRDNLAMPVSSLRLPPRGPPHPVRGLGLPQLPPGAPSPLTLPTSVFFQRLPVPPSMLRTGVSATLPSLLP